MQRLQKILSELHPELKPPYTAMLVDDGILDSLDMVTLITDINDAYGIDIGVEDMIPENFNTFDSILSLIKRHGGRLWG